MKKLFALLIGTILLFANPIKSNLKGKYIIPLKANEENISSEVISTSEEEELSSSSIVVEEDDEPSIKNAAKGFWEDDVLPFVASISLGSLVSVCVSFLFAMKNKNTISEVANSSTQAVSVAKETITKLEGATIKMIELINEQNTTMKSNKEQNEKILKVMNDFKTTMAECKEDLSKMGTVKKSTDNLIIVHSKMANNSQELVTNGVAEEINKIVKDNHLEEGK